jgi:hypothetical protein
MTMTTTTSGSRANELRQRLEGLSDPCSALAGLLELAPCAIALYDGDGRCVSTNAAYRDLFGCSPAPGIDLGEDEVLGKSGVLFWLRRALCGETIATPTFWYEHATAVRGSRRMALSARAFPMRTPAGEVELVAFVFRDETDAALFEEMGRHDPLEVAHATLREAQLSGDQLRDQGREDQRRLAELGGAGWTTRRTGPGRRSSPVPTPS